MQNSEPKDNGDKGYEEKSFAKYGGIAFQMIAVIGIFAYAGYRIDKAAAHSVQWATAALSLIGVFIAMYIVFKSLKA